MTAPFFGKNPPSLEYRNTLRLLRQASAVAVIVGVAACGKTVDPTGCHDVVDAICAKVFQCNPDADATLYVLYGHSVAECESYWGAQCDAPDANTLCQGLRSNPQAEECAQIIANASCTENPSCADAGIVCGN